MSFGTTRFFFDVIVNEILTRAILVSGKDIEILGRVAYNSRAYSFLKSGFSFRLEIESNFINRNKV